MNPRILTVTALLVAIATCAYFFLWSGPSPVAPPDFDSVDSQSGDRTANARPERISNEEPSSENQSGSVAEKPAINWKGTAIMGGADATAKPTPEDIARFLAKHGETAVNLVAAFEKTRDRRLLERALELFPNSPVVLMAAIEAAPIQEAKGGEKYVPDAERVALIERFKTADPNNPLPWIFSAQERFKSGTNAEAIAEIRASLERSAFYTYSTERMDAAQRLYEDMGLHPIEAGLLAMAGLTLPHISAANQISRMLMEWQKQATDSGDAAAADEALRLTYSLGRTFATPEASRTLIGQLVGIAMEARTLKALPADAQPDWLAVPPSQRLAEMEAQKQTVRDLTSSVDRLIKSQDEPLLTEYLRRNRADGELSALTWLKAQRK